MDALPLGFFRRGMVVRWSRSWSKRRRRMLGCYLSSVATHFFGLYPYEEQWRSATACAAIMVTVGTSCIPFFWSAKRLPLVWLGGYALFYALMRGGFLGLATGLETQWGGLALTLFVFATVVLTGMPLAICLALLRRSRLPVIARTTAAVIDAIRSLPLVAILFTAAIVLPYALPQFLLGDKLYRVIAGFSLWGRVRRRRSSQNMRGRARCRFWRMTIRNV